MLFDSDNASPNIGQQRVPSLSITLRNMRLRSQSFFYPRLKDWCQMLQPVFHMGSTRYLEYGEHLYTGGVGFSCSFQGLIGVH